MIFHQTPDTRLKRSCHQLHRLYLVTWLRIICVVLTIPMWRVGAAYLGHTQPVNQYSSQRGSSESTQNSGSLWIVFNNYLRINFQSLTKCHLLIQVFIVRKLRLCKSHIGCLSTCQHKKLLLKAFKQFCNSFEQQNHKHSMHQKEDFKSWKIYWVVLAVSCLRNHRLLKV